MPKALSLALVMAGLSALAGCYEDTDVTLHEQGVYKGEADPLLQVEADNQHQQQLRERFRNVQADR